MALAQAAFFDDPLQLAQNEAVGLVLGHGLLACYNAFMPTVKQQDQKIRKRSKRSRPKAKPPSTYLSKVKSDHQFGWLQTVDITPSMFRFGLEYVYSGNLFESYKAAYPKSALKMRYAWVVGNAKRLLSNPKVLSLIEEIRTEILAYEKILPEMYIAECAKLRNVSVERDDMKAAARFQELIGRSLGYDAYNVNIRKEPMSEGEALAKLQALVEACPDVAKIIQAAAPEVIPQLVELRPMRGLPAPVEVGAEEQNAGGERQKQAIPPLLAAVEAPDQ